MTAAVVINCDAVMTDAVQGGPPDGRQVLGNVPCLRNHAMMTDAVVINCDGRQLLCIVPCLRSHAVMDDRCSAGGGEPPDGRQVLGDVPCGRLHLHQVHTGQPKHRLVCFYLLLVLYITYAGLGSRQEHEAVTDISSSSGSSSSNSSRAAAVAAAAEGVLNLPDWLQVLSWPES